MSFWHSRYAISKLLAAQAPLRNVPPKPQPKPQPKLQKAA